MLNFASVLAEWYSEWVAGVCCWGFSGGAGRLSKQACTWNLVPTEAMDPLPEAQEGPGTAQVVHTDGF